MPSLDTGPRMQWSRAAGYTRLELEDLEDLENFIYDYVANAFGAVMGPGSGPLGPIYFDTTASISAIPVGAFQLYYSNVDGLHVDAAKSSGTAAGGVVTYDPTSPEQSGNTTVDMSGVVGTDGAFIYATLGSVTVSPGTGQKWLVGSGEVSDTDNDHLKRVLSFGAAVSVPAGSVPIAVAESWNGSVPTIKTIHPADSDGARIDLVGTASFDGVRISEWANERGIFPGYFTILGKLVNQLAQIKDSVWKFNDPTGGPDSGTAGTLAWDSEPNRGLKQLDDDLATVEAINSHGRILGSGSWDTANQLSGLTTNVSVTNVPSTLTAQVDFLVQGQVTHAAFTPLVGGAALSSDHSIQIIDMTYDGSANATTVRVKLGRINWTLDANSRELADALFDFTFCFVGSA